MAMTGVFGLLGFALLLPAQQDGESAGSIIAIVGNDAITKNEIENSLFRGGAAAGSLFNSRDYKPEIVRAELDRMIDELLILQAAAVKAGGAGATKSRGGKPEEEGEDATRERTPRAGESSYAAFLRRYIDEREVDWEIDKELKRLREEGQEVRTRQQFYDYMRRAHGLSEAQVRDQVRRQAAIRKFLVEEIFKSVDRWIRPEELKYYYRSHLDEFTVPVEVSFRQIYLRLDQINSVVAMRAIEEGLKAGKPFVELARSYSQDYDNVEYRGQVLTRSFQELQEWQAPIPQELRKLEKKTVSRPIRSSRGIHYFYVEDRVEGKPKPFEDAQKEIEEGITRARRLQAYKKFLERQRARTTIKILLPGVEEDAAKAPASSSR